LHRQQNKPDAAAVFFETLQPKRHLEGIICEANVNPLLAALTTEPV
jgi:hypothetical protein